MAAVVSDGSHGEQWRLLGEDPVVRLVWGLLTGADVLLWSRAHSIFWGASLELIPMRLHSRGSFALLTSGERAAALQALPAVEGALLFENFSRPWMVSKKNFVCAVGDARGEGSPCGPSRTTGKWVIGPGTFSPPHMERCLSNSTVVKGRPFSTWCLRMTNEDTLSDFDPTGLVWCFPQPVRPKFATFRCKPAASRPFRAGGIFALAQGLGNDKGPEMPAVFVQFTRDPDGRVVSVHRAGGTSVAIGEWADGQWCTVSIAFDWGNRITRCSVGSDNSARGSGAVVEVPFKSDLCTDCQFLLLYNQTCDFEACWTDILVS
eukprot:TRINITY_DN68595_c0_g1_i1.p1 TRINITY_DN68595_c0_g1~~TRINITY_DN68595_c0_g1_i1.p1  ORF type:complete len:319 (+),score=24.80 TRINITY_DN68595_c0_g1_i1:66-1022(+)